jgi:hypothetical protein
MRDLHWVSRYHCISPHWGNHRGVHQCHDEEFPPRLRSHRRLSTRSAHLGSPAGGRGGTPGRRGPRGNVVGAEAADGSAGRHDGEGTAGGGGCEYGLQKARSPFFCPSVVFADLVGRIISYVPESPESRGILHHAMIESLRAFRYSTQAAIADLIDNRISAGAKGGS